MIHTRKLANGTRIIFEPVEHTEALSLGFWFLHGSRDEQDGEQGFSHFLEHMVFKGTRTRSAFQIAQSIERVGGYLNAFTEKEITCYYCLLPREHAVLAIDVLADMMTDSLLLEEEIEREKKVVINEILAGEDNSEELSHEVYLETLWQRHPLARKITGESSEVASIERSRLEAFYRGHYVGGNLIVTAAGSIDPAELFDLLEQRLEKIPAGSCPDRRRPPERQAGCAYRKDRFQQVHLYVGTEITWNEALEDYYRTLVFSTAFGESMSSRLFQELREQRGLCYSVFSFRNYFSDTGLWTIYGNTTPGQTLKLIDAVRAELRRLLDEPLSDREIEDARNQIKGNLVLSRLDMETRMRRLLRQYQLAGYNLDYDESFRLLDEVSAEHVREVARRLIVPNRFNMLVYGGRRTRGFENLDFSI